MTGDISADGERELTGACGVDGLSCDFLKAAHHGSKYSNCGEFLEAVNPSYVVFQVGKNTFGHPTAEALEICGRNGAVIYRNDKNGAIAVFIEKGEKPVIKTIIQ
jgi:competence protein ComEC